MPIVLNVHTADEIVAAVKAIAPGFGGINLEDIAAPICFEVEDRLKKDLAIPVMHDDQHGTAVVVLAGLINAMKVTGRQLKNCKVVVVGAGAAGTAIIKLIYKYSGCNILAIDSKGIISKNRKDLNSEKIKLLKYTNKNSESGLLKDALKDSDVFIGVSKAGLLNKNLVRTMAKSPIIFAMANPTPEIMPGAAHDAGALVVATGRSDFPNQVNNALAFPGIFRGALDNKVNNITDNHKLAAAEALAGLVSEPSAECIIPSVSDKRIVPAIAKVIV